MAEKTELEGNLRYVITELMVPEWRERVEKREAADMHALLKRIAEHYPRLIDSIDDGEIYCNRGLPELELQVVQAVLRHLESTDFEAALAAATEEVIAVRLTSA